MATYSDKDFTDLVGDKPGNIRVFRRKLKDFGLLGNRQQLTDEHETLFLKIKEMKRERSLGWDQAMELEISNYVSQISNQVTEPDLITNIEDPVSQYKQVNIRMNEELYEWYKNESEYDGIPMSALMIMALKSYMRDCEESTLYQDMKRRNREIAEVARTGRGTQRSTQRHPGRPQKKIQTEEE